MPPTPPPSPEGSPTRRPLSLIPPDREASLRNRIAARDERALVELVEVATPWLLGIAQGMLGDADEAEDVVMEAFRLAWEHVTPTTEASRGLMPYLLRVTRHRAIDRLRSRKRAQRRQLALTAVEEPSVPAVEPNEAALPGWHLHSQVHEALAALPPDQRTAVQLAYFEGLTQSEIAGALGIPLGTVKTRLRLAFGRLRTTLAHAKDWVL
jgi:RNA polymerase sigma-70 factor (ECF subfamily)